jgi:hypothetical protein
MPKSTTRLPIAERREEFFESIAAAGRTYNGVLDYTDIAIPDHEDRQLTSEAKSTAIITLVLMALVTLTLILVATRGLSAVHKAQSAQPAVSIPR